MGRSSLEGLCFFIAAVRRGTSLAAHFYISYAMDFFGNGPRPVHRACHLQVAGLTNDLAVLRPKDINALGRDYKSHLRGSKPYDGERPFASEAVGRTSIAMEMLMSA